MNLYTLVRPEHLNHFGKLFGGQMLKWVDEYAALAAMRQFPGARLVTIGMDRVVFTRGVESGSTLRFHVEHERTGTTSVTFKVNVFAQEMDTVDEYQVFETSITFVCVGGDGEKRALPCRARDPRADQD